MLEGLPRTEYKGPIYRLAGPRDIARVAAKRGLDAEEIADLAAALGPAFASDELIDAPFQPYYTLDGVPAFGGRTRFSDGSFPVLYASETAETSETEVRYHREQAAMADATARLPVTLCVFHCELDTKKAVDLRPFKDGADWEALTSPVTANPVCLTLGKEANSAGNPDPEAFLAPSARCDGTTTPVFKREVLSNAAMDRVVRIIFDEATGQITGMHPV